jgi:1-acyl-sn-glycerol-3-phosphate acyltransferase
VKRAVASGVVALARILAGGNVLRIGFEPDERQRIYFANHTSHLDFVVIWSALPKRLRLLTRPVAARDYWEKGVKRYLALHVFNAVLVDRARGDAGAPNALDVLLAGLGEKHSLIIFPEGTRGDGTQLGAFKSGLYRLGLARPDVELVPVYIDNLNRVLPKGEFAPVPMLASVSFGAPMRVGEGESKADFLDRARNAILELRQW